MTVRIATVLSARDWEPALVAHARESAAVKVVVRAYQPGDIDRHLDGIDVVVAGGDTSWVTPSLTAMWRSLGLGVVGVVPEGDEPAARLLEKGGVDEVVPDTIDVTALVQAIRFTAPSGPRPEPPTRGRVVLVLGPRGAPGVTEIAAAYALGRRSRSETVLIDLDTASPSLAVRLGLPPRPDVIDVADALRSESTIGEGLVHRFEGLVVITGTYRAGMPPLTREMRTGIIRVASTQWSDVVVDCGTSGTELSDLETADEVILVIDGSPVGIVRAADLTTEWLGPAPAIVVNRVPPQARRQVVDAVRRWTGLDPVLVLPDRPAVRRSAASARPPDRRFARQVASLEIAR
jgi:MinD-like ATPase involved in chromosome partitioning or flagellar assembly